jgi:hypothetical protein
VTLASDQCSESIDGGISRDHWSALGAAGETSLVTLHKWLNVKLHDIEVNGTLGGYEPLQFHSRDFAYADPLRKRVNGLKGRRIFDEDEG